MSLYDIPKRELFVPGIFRRFFCGFGDTGILNESGDVVGQLERSPESSLSQPSSCPLTVARLAEQLSID